MRLLTLLITVLLSLNATIAQTTKPKDDTPRLARTYYNSGEYEKALELYKKLYTTTSLIPYFDSYILCLTLIPQYKQAEKELKLMIRERPRLLKYYIMLGDIYQKQGLQNRAEKMYQTAVDKISGGAEVNSLVNAFIGTQQYDWAERTIERAGQLNPLGKYHGEKARLYRLQRNYPQMTSELLKWLKDDPKKINTIQSYLSSAIHQDNDGRIGQQILSIIVAANKANNTFIPLQRLLAWYYLKLNRYDMALEQYAIINKTTQEEEAMIYNVARSATTGKDYDTADRAFRYLIALGEKSRHFSPAHLGKGRYLYEMIVSTISPSATAIETTITALKQSIEAIGKTRDSYNLMIMVAHLEAFYQGKTDTAIAALEEAGQIKRLTGVAHAEIKLEMANIYVLMNDPWQATLFYSQVINQLKDHPLADEAKWRKAWLSFFMGNFSWAKAQLEGMKGSTSKLTSNDAINLSLLISSNTNLDTTNIPLKLFARAEYHIFLKKEQAALATLDSLLNQYPESPVCDDALFRKAGLYEQMHDYQAAAKLYLRITKEYARGTLGDDALFRLAVLYEQHLNNPTEARDAYKSLILRYPSSAFSSDAREKLRTPDTP